MDELTKELDDAQTADPVDDAQVAQLQSDLEHANVENERVKAQADEAAQSLASIKDRLEIAVDKKEEADHAAEKRGVHRPAQKDLNEAVAEQKQAQDVADNAKKMVETAIAVADATKKYEEAKNAVENIKAKIEEAKNADPVDEELVRSLENDLTTAESVAANHKQDLDEILHKAGPMFQDKSDRDEERADAAEEFKQVRDEVASSSSVTAALTLPGYTKATFDGETRVIFKKVIATVVETVDATITVDDIVIASVEDVAARRRLLQQTAATVSFVVYSDGNLDEIVIALNDQDLTTLTRDFKTAGLENLSGDVSVAVPAEKQVAQSPEDKKSSEERQLEKERADAAAEFKKMRGVKTSTRSLTRQRSRRMSRRLSPRSRRRRSSSRWRRRRFRRRDIPHRCAGAARERPTAEEKTKIHAQIETLRGELVTAENDVQKTSQAVEEAEAWAVAAEEYSEALSEVAEIKNQLADARPSAATTPTGSPGCVVR